MLKVDSLVPVWKTMQLMQRERDWGPTDPQVLTPGGNW
jgi:hypothetical protein